MSFSSQSLAVVLTTKRKRQNRKKQNNRSQSKVALVKECKTYSKENEDKTEDSLVTFCDIWPSFASLSLLTRWQEGHPVCQNLESAIPKDSLGDLWGIWSGLTKPEVISGKTGWLYKNWR